MDLISFGERFGVPMLCLLLLAVQYIRQERHHRAELKLRDKREAALQLEIDRQKEMRIEQVKAQASMEGSYATRFEQALGATTEVVKQQTLTLEARTGGEDG